MISTFFVPMSVAMAALAAAPSVALTLPAPFVALNDVPSLVSVQDSVSVSIIDALLAESDFLETCADVKLPYSSVSDENEVLKCMLNHVTSVAPSEFGLDPLSACYPPGYTDIFTVCPTILAPRALAECGDASTLDIYYNNDDFTMSFQYDDYEMSMPYDEFQDDVVDNEDDDSSVTAKFCNILQGLSSQSGRECLDLVCSEETAVPSSAPTMAPSASPSESPSSVPSGAPSMQPTMTPTLAEIQGVILTDFVASVVLNVTLPSSETARDELEDALAGSFADVLDVDKDDVNVTLTEGSSRRVRRRLQDRVVAQVAIRSNHDCYVNDCDTYGTSLLEEMAGLFEEAVQDGSFTEAIRQKAIDQDVEELKWASTTKDSYVLVRSDKTVTDPPVTDPEVTPPSSSPSRPTMAVTIISSLAIAVCTFLW